MAAFISLLLLPFRFAGWTNLHSNARRVGAAADGLSARANQLRRRALCARCLHRALSLSCSLHFVLIFLLLARTAGEQSRRTDEPAAAAGRVAVLRSGQSHSLHCDERVSVQLHLVLLTRHDLNLTDVM